MKNGIVRDGRGKMQKTLFAYFDFGKECLDFYDKGNEREQTDHGSNPQVY